jgi:hypothetical protein
MAYVVSPRQQKLHGMNLYWHSSGSNLQLGPNIGPSTYHGQIAGVDGTAGVLKKGGVLMALVASRRWYA